MKDAEIREKIMALVEHASLHKINSDDTTIVLSVAQLHTEAQTWLLLKILEELKISNALCAAAD